MFAWNKNDGKNNIRSIKQRRIFDGGIQNQIEIMSCLLET